MSNDSDTDANIPGPHIQNETDLTTVSGTILRAYLDALAATDGFADIAPRLREAILGRGPINDAAIRSALFGEDA